MVLMGKMEQRDHLDRLGHEDLLVRVEEGDHRETLGGQDHQDVLVPQCMRLPFEDGLNHKFRLMTITSVMHLKVMHRRQWKPFARLLRRLLK